VIEISVSDKFCFAKDELIFSVKTDHAKGKVYRAGTAFGIEPGMVEETDMATGEVRVVSDRLPQGSGLPQASWTNPYEAEASSFVTLRGFVDQQYRYARLFNRPRGYSTRRAKTTTN
jgi:hypothetical protein